MPGDRAENEVCRDVRPAPVQAAQCPAESRDSRRGGCWSARGCVQEPAPAEIARQRRGTFPERGSEVARCTGAVGIRRARSPSVCPFEVSSGAHRARAGASTQHNQPTTPPVEQPSRSTSYRTTRLLLYKRHPVSPPQVPLRRALHTTPQPWIAGAPALAIGAIAVALRPGLSHAVRRAAAATVAVAAAAATVAVAALPVAALPVASPRTTG